MRERRKVLVGRVVSDQMQKTVMVAVQSLRRHRLYRRMMRRTKKYMAHDEQDTTKVGDLVRIQESRPISRHKHWQVIAVVERAAERGKAVALPMVTQAGQELSAVATADVDAVLVETAPVGGPDLGTKTGQEEERQ